MKSPFSLIRNPYLTEKVMFLKEAQNKVVFKVAPDCNKIEVKKAIEEIFKVKVLNVRTINVKGKTKRLGVHQGKRADWKKAIVMLQPGETIEYFEGA